MTSGDSVNAIAKKAGISQPTLSRQIREDRLSPLLAVQIARAYGGNPVEPLIIAGVLTPEDLRQPVTVTPASELSNETLLALLGERLQ